VKITPGLLAKANFAVVVPSSVLRNNVQKDLSVSVTQGLDTSRPDLEVQMAPEVLKLGVGILERQPSFKLKINYPEFVKSWFLEVRDESATKSGPDLALPRHPPKSLGRDRPIMGF